MSDFNPDCYSLCNIPESFFLIVDLKGKKNMQDYRACKEKKYYYLIPQLILFCIFSRELMHGIPVFDENGNRLGESKIAAKSAITQVVFSRIMMATPGMSMY